MSTDLLCKQGNSLSAGGNYPSRKERIIFFTFYSHLNSQECNIPICKQLHHFKGTFDPA
ncbi:MAG TPA: hypothetical protein P5334_04160 [Candidatus Syntrophosphaera sp.]|nr:hypothetical protein [Candidatus Syntrophosphaera sp.]